MIPSPRELVERAFELGDKRSQNTMVFAQEIEDFLGFSRFGKGGVTAQIAKNDDDLAAMAFENVLVAFENAAITAAVD
jgi:hypothetical protein